MRPVREITKKEENARIEPRGSFDVIKRDPVEPEPVGTIIMMAFRITGYHLDCDGSLMVKAECVDKRGEVTGWDIDSIGLCPSTALVVSQEELNIMFR